MILRIGLGKLRTARRFWAAFAIMLSCAAMAGTSTCFAQETSSVQPLDAASRQAISEVEAASADAAIAPVRAPAQAVEEPAAQPKRGFFNGRSSGRSKAVKEEPAPKQETGIDPKTGKRFLPSFQFDPGQVDSGLPVSQVGEPSMPSPSGQPLRQFQPSGPPGMGVVKADPKPVAPKPVAPKAPKKPRKSAPVDPMQAALRGETAFNPKFGPPKYNPEADPSVIQDGEMATTSGAQLSQFTPTGPSEYGKTADSKSKQAKPAAAETEAESAAGKLAKRNQGWMSNNDARPLPKLDMGSIEPADSPTGEVTGSAQLTQFTPTGPPDLGPSAKPAPKSKKAEVGPAEDPNAAKRAQFAKYFETEHKRPLPTLEVDFAQTSGMVSDASAADGGPFTELAMGPSVAGRPMKHFDAVPPDVPIQLRPVEVEPIDRKRGRGKKGAEEPPQDNTRRAYDEFYGMESKFAMPTLEAPAEVWEEGDKVFITGAPKTANGRQLTPFGGATAPGMPRPTRPGGLIPGLKGEYEADFSQIAASERRGADAMLAEVGPPEVIPPEAPMIEVVPPEPEPYVEVAAAQPDAPTYLPPNQMTGNDLDPQGWPIPETPIEKIAARSVFAVAQRLAGQKPVVGQPSLFPPELMPGGEGEPMPDGDLDLPGSEAPTLDETPIIPDLRGIQLASTWSKGQNSAAAGGEGEQASTEATGVESVEGGAVAEVGPPKHSTFSDNLTIEGDLEVPDAVQQMFAEQIGQPLSLASLDSMLREAIAGYQGSDIPVVDISIPEQEITDGILKLDVLEARLGRTIVENAEDGGTTEYTEPEYLMTSIGAGSGDKLRSSELLNDVAWLNRYPFRRVDLIYAPGQQFGETDVILRAIERRPWLFYTTLDNTGNDLLGEYRASAAMTVGSPFGLDDHLMAYAYSTDTDLEHLQSHSLAYTMPVYWNKIRPERNQRNMLTIIGAFADVQSEQIIDGQILALEGFSGQASMRYLLPLPRKTGVNRELDFGIDWKASNNNLQFNTLEVFDTTTHIYQASLGYRSRYEQFLGLQGYATLDMDIVFSPGGISSSNGDEIFASARSGAEAQYAYARGAVEWHVPLNDWEMVARLTGQVASTNLLATETLGAGGAGDLRGFDERIIRGDSGFIFGLEARTPSLEVPSFVDWRGESLAENWQGVFFYDAAALTNVHKQDGEPDWFGAQSAGIGLRYEFNNTFTLEVDYGWVIDASGFDVEEGSRIHVKGQITK